MTVGTARPATDPELLAQVITLVRRAADEDGDDQAWDIRPDTRIEGDLFLESAELVALGEALRRRYGDAIDLVGSVAGLGIDEIIGLTVADVAAYVASASVDPDGAGRAR